MNYNLMYIAALLATFGITVLISRKLIPILKSRKMGQTILEIGPRWHKNKEGTPTMGGLAFIAAAAITGIAASVYLAVIDGIRSTLPFMFTLAFGIVCGLIGCVDDTAKLRRKQNEGLTAPQKFLLQLIAAALYLLGMTLVCGIDTTIYIPFFGAEIDFGFFYYVIALLLLTGVDNAVNLTDGLDGLCSSVTLVVGLFFTAAGYMNGLAEPDGDVILLGAVLIGACAGFLVYNFYPARVFMGDTGSLFLGGLVVGGSFMIDNPLLVVVFGIVYIIETASVILQVGYFKLTHGKRLFKMAPIHHHFEKCGWSEIKIGIAASALTAVMAVVSILFGLK
ncbi:MAG: phospho-N-acetylmuramoyl-pentapeptide-transferase [Clostridia bacterium]|nr:phospho-N-acetylmuramoyl-pentapeptide-transferase [Clostridia bacterium]MBQ9997026.1 phospho-N-acetylmuramoyl-pentapeptide-transferase [Clostridia bacterium]